MTKLINISLIFFIGVINSYSQRLDLENINYEKEIRYVSFGYFIMQDTILKYRQERFLDKFSTYTPVNEFIRDTINREVNFSFEWTDHDTFFYHNKYGKTGDTLIVKRGVVGKADTLIKKFDSNIDSVKLQYPFDFQYPNYYFVDTNIVYQSKRRNFLYACQPIEIVKKDMIISKILSDFNSLLHENSMLIRIKLENGYSLLNCYINSLGKINYQIIKFKYTDYGLLKIISDKNFVLTEKKTKKFLKILNDNEGNESFACPLDNSIGKFDVIITQNNRYITSLNCLNELMIKNNNLKRLMQLSNNLVESQELSLRK